MIDFDIMKRFHSKPKNRAGLDIGTSHIKMVEVSGALEKTSLVAFGIKKIQGSSKESIVDAIKALSEEVKISVKEFTISLSGPSLIARIISMPKMTDDELKNAVKFETEKFIPFDINECILDFHVQGDDVREKNNVDILLAAAKKDFVLQKVKIVEEAGFSVGVVDVDSFAITNAFLKNFTTEEPAKTVALLNIGAACTNLIILKNGLISFVRDVAIGTDAFNVAVSKKCGLPVEMPEGLKDLSSEKMGEVMVCAKAVLANLLDETKLSFGYHENQSGGNIDEVYISGGGSRFPALEEAFGETLGSKPNSWNPFQFMDIDPARINVDELVRVKDSFAVAAGLALR